MPLLFARIAAAQEIAWQRRLTRAVQMAQGARDASGMDNYEQLPVYAVAADYEAIAADAREAVASVGARTVYPRAAEALEPSAAVDLSAHQGSYDWLRLYFEEVIWPEAERVRGRVEELHRAGVVQLHTVRGDEMPAEVERATRRVIKRAILA